MASLSLYPQFETNLMSTGKDIELLLQLKSTKADGKNYIKVKPYLIRHLLRNCLLQFCKKNIVHTTFPRGSYFKGLYDKMIGFVHIQ